MLEVGVQEVIEQRDDVVWLESEKMWEYVVENVSTQDQIACEIWLHESGIVDKLYNGKTLPP